MVARTILNQELWAAMENLEQEMAELPGMDAEIVAQIAERAGNSSHGFPPRPRADDPVGTARYHTELLRIVVGVLREHLQAGGQ